MKREEMVKLRDVLIRGAPPYTVDAIGNLKREKGGVPGLDELKKLGDFSPTASAVRLSLEAHVAIIDHLLEKMR